MTAAFDAIIADERRAGGPAGDHFAKAGANDRVWNALEKLAVRDPETFVDYYANDVLALVSQRLARPGLPGHLAGQRRPTRRAGAGPAPRLPPRLPVERPAVEQYPTHVHLLSPVLTLQGAVAHSRHAGRERPDDVPAVLPPVRARLPRLAAARVPRVLRASTTCSCRCARATPCSSTRRCSTAPGPTSPPTSSAWPTCCRSRRPSAGRWRPSTATGSCRAVYPVLLRRAAGAPDAALAHAVAAAAEGYPFPTNLDLDQPVDGLTPPSQAEIVARRSSSAAPRQRAGEPLDAYAGRRDTSIPMSLLADKVVLVSGGTQGVGAAIARAAVDAGATVAVSGRRKAVGQAFAAELRNAGGRPAAYVAAETSADQPSQRGKKEKKNVLLWALMTTGRPSSLAALSASAGVRATRLRGTLTSNLEQQFLPLVFVNFHQKASKNEIWRNKARV